jgi:hypothetical protein
MQIHMNSKTDQREGELDVTRLKQYIAYSRAYVVTHQHVVAKLCIDCAVVLYAANVRRD